MHTDAADLALMQDNPAYPAHKKVASVLTSVAEELQDVPLYYDLHALCKTVHCSPPPADILRSAIVNAGMSLPLLHSACRLPGGGSMFVCLLLHKGACAWSGCGDTAHSKGCRASPCCAMSSVVRLQVKLALTVIRMLLLEHAEVQAQVLQLCVHGSAAKSKGLHHGTGLQAGWHSLQEHLPSCP